MEMNMLVSELITALSKLDPTLPVYATIGDPVIFAIGAPEKRIVNTDNELTDGSGKPGRGQREVVILDVEGIPE